MADGEDNARQQWARAITAALARRGLSRSQFAEAHDIQIASLNTWLAPNGRELPDPDRRGHDLHRALDDDGELDRLLRAARADAAKPKSARMADPSQPEWYAGTWLQVIEAEQVLWAGRTWPRAQRTEDRVELTVSPRRRGPNAKAWTHGRALEGTITRVFPEAATKTWEFSGYIARDQSRALLLDFVQTSGFQSRGSIALTQPGADPDLLSGLYVSRRSIAESLPLNLASNAPDVPSESPYIFQMMVPRPLAWRRLGEGVSWPS